MDVHGWIDAYLDHLRVERALAKNTLEAYARDLGELATQLPEDAAEEVRRIDGSHVLAFVIAASTRGSLRARRGRSTSSVGSVSIAFSRRRNLKKPLSADS